MSEQCQHSQNFVSTSSWKWCTVKIFIYDDYNDCDNINNNKHCWHDVMTDYYYYLHVCIFVHMCVLVY